MNAMATPNTAAAATMRGQVGLMGFGHILDSDPALYCVHIHEQTHFFALPRS